MSLLIFATIGSGIYASMHDDMQAFLHGVIYLAILLVIQHPIRQKIKIEEEKTAEFNPDILLTKRRYFIVTLAAFVGGGPFFTLHLITREYFPGRDELTEIGRRERPGAMHIAFVSIAEVSEEDFEEFKI